MSGRFPLLATTVVVAAIALMIGLGVWQLDRARQKEAQLALYSANIGAPPVAFPAVPVDDQLLFRQTTAFCLTPISTALEGAGKDGFRIIAQCRSGAEGPGFPVQLGTTRQPHAHVAWKGGAVDGYIGQAPDNRSFLRKLFDRRPSTLMVVARTPLAGLSANPPPDLSAVPNNHRSYAVQWFAFAGIAAIIYLLALRGRRQNRSGR